ncbi:MAG: lytic transglycosylase domain-containing protein [Pseudorhodobacter sp.]
MRSIVPACLVWAVFGLGASASLPVGLHAQSLEPATEFAPRRVGLPAAKGPRITVQIDPAEQARRLAALPKVQPTRPTPPGEGVATAPAPVAPATPGASYGWFWDIVPVAATAGAGRFPTAISALSQKPGGGAVRAPRLQHLQEVAKAHGTEILKATIGTNVSPALVLAVIGIESAGRVDAVSSAGAKGLMQLIPATAERFGVKDSTDPGQNIRGGVAYLDWLMRHFDSDPVLVLAAYNAGEGAVKANGGVPPYAETRDYVPKVLAAWQVAQGLCLTPPQLVSDPCVFKVISAGG